VGNTVLGNVAYIFWTSTYRCWKRGLHRIYNVSNSWKISNMDGEEQWKGIVQYKHHFYHWLAGYPRSGYYHYRQGHFTNCVFHYGCVSDSYPVNTIAAHSNGTFKWKANGAA
ncbi:MAG: hypothetical protein ACRDQ1_16545, partial [Sciscionella sp.]